MDSGLYAAYSGLLARTQALDTAANNLANAGTSGFRAERDYFRGVLAGSLENSGSGSSQVGQAVNHFGILGGNGLDLRQGTLATTGNPLDLAVEGEGFFAVQTKQGTRYTRDGGFMRSSAGVLQTREGEAVLDGQGNPITVPTGTVSVSGDGTVSVSTPEGSTIAGQVGVFTFANASSLTAEGTNRFVAADGQTAIAASGTIHAGALEGANEDAVHGTMNMILVQRQAEMMQKALSVFHNDFDKTASGRVEQGLGQGTGIKKSKRRFPSGMTTRRAKARSTARQESLEAGKMIRALYTAASGMSAQQANLDTVANNLANSGDGGVSAEASAV